MTLKDEIANVVDNDKDLKKEGVRTRTLADLPDCGVEEWISTGSMLINGMIGRPGVPVGMMTLISGKPFCGKSTLATHILAEVQKIGGLAVLLETEYKYDPSRAERIGVRRGETLFYQPGYLEQAFALISRICDASMKAGAPQPIAIVLDSHSATPTRAEVNADDDASRGEVATSARVTSLHLRRLIPSGQLRQGRVALIVVCQPKSQVGGPPGFGPPPETFLAEKPLGYHCALRLKFTSSRQNKVGDEVVGTDAKLKCAKNNVGPPFRTCDISFSTDGIDEAKALLDLGLEYKVISIAGAGWYTYGDEKFRKKGFSDFLDQHPSLRRTLFGYASGMLGKDE